MKEIKLTQAKVALVDDEDYERLSVFNWHCENGRKTMYAKKNTWCSGKAGTMFMHREVLGLKKGDGKIVDHIDQNGLNNQRNNLRIVEHSLNLRNSGLTKRSTSGFKGVSYCKQTGKWAARLPKSVWIGRFLTKEEAVHAVGGAYVV